MILDTNNHSHTLHILIDNCSENKKDMTLLIWTSKQVKHI